jgi:hypothetical protein
MYISFHNYKKVIVENSTVNCHNYKFSLSWYDVYYDGPVFLPGSHCGY